MHNSLTSRYDERGNGIGQCFFGIDGKPKGNSSGIACVTWRYNERGNKLEEALFGVDGKPTIPRNDFAATQRFSYTDDGDTLIAATYLDERGEMIPIEVEVQAIVPNSVATKAGLMPGDRLLSYASVEIQSTQQFIYLVGRPAETPRTIVYRRGENVLTVDIPPGRVGVQIHNIPAKRPIEGELPAH